MSKITDLTAASAVDLSNDQLVIVDVSDTTMGATGTTKKVAPSVLQSAFGGGFAMYEVTNAQRLAGTRSDDSTLLVSGDIVKVTDQGDRIEQLLDDTDPSDNDNWLILLNTIQLKVYQVSGSAKDFTIAGQSAVSVPHGVATVVGWARPYILLTSNITGSPAPSWNSWGYYISSGAYLSAGLTMYGDLITTVVPPGPDRGLLWMSRYSA